MLKNIVILIVIVLLFSRCDYIRMGQFMDMCSTNPNDESTCKCIFKVVDNEVKGELGTYWVYKPDIGKYPQLHRAIAKAERQCRNEMYRGR